jgi:hypothetical protein
MTDSFHFDPTAYRKRVSRIAQHVVGRGDAIPTIAPQSDTGSDHRSEGAVTVRDGLGRRFNVVTRRSM